MALTKAQEEQRKRSAEYWRQREAATLVKNLKDEKAYERELERIYKDMLDGCQKEIDAFYGRYATKENITIAEAQKRVSKADIAAYERKAERYVKAALADMEKYGDAYKAIRNTKDYFSEQANAEMRLYNAMMKINRLEMLKANIGLELIKGHSEQEAFMASVLKGRTMDELKRQAGILGKTVIGNEKRATAIAGASFYNATFSDRVWANQSKMKADLSKMLESALIAGKNPHKLKKELEKYFIGSKPGVKKGSAEWKKGAVHAADRLLRTELARVQTEAQKESLIRNGYAQYIYMTLAGCCPICADVESHNGGVYNIKDMKVGLNAPPMHPFCRCSIAAYDDSDDYEEWLNFLEAGGTTEEYNKLKKAGKPIVPSNVASQATKEEPKDDTMLSVEDFSEVFTNKKEIANTRKFVDFVNKQKDANPKVLKLYKALGKIEQYAKHGIPFKVSHGKHHAISYSYNPKTMKLTDVKIVIPKLKGDNIMGQVGTMLHEKMHLIDKLLKKDPTTAGTYFAADNDKFKKAYRDVSGYVGKDVIKLFNDFDKEYKAVSEKYKKKHIAAQEELKAKYLPNGIWGEGADYDGYKKASAKLRTEIDDARNHESRLIMGGGVDALMDIYDAMSEGFFRDEGVVIYGHGSRYFKSTEAQINEIIANFAQLSVLRPDLVEVLRKDQPELVKALDELIEDMGKAVDDFE